MASIPFIKVYNSYGNHGHILIIGHLFLVPERQQVEQKRVSNNFIALLQLFRKKTIPNARLRLWFDGQAYHTTTEFDGFFKFDFHTGHREISGWNDVEVELLGKEDEVICSSRGALYMPERTRYAFISDIDDTIMKSYSATIIRRLYELISRSPAKRRFVLTTPANSIMPWRKAIRWMAIKTPSSMSAAVSGTSMIT
ncbi:MAG: hypothetical protein KL787_04930 [Taibaiella sp.]|nr:hypothetical protein [Taibaiella sp.]